MTIIVPLLILHVCISRIFLALDDFIFPEYRKRKVNQVVFISGFPRSGTTYLLNLMATDQKNFTSFRLWEMIFAPSIIQKKVITWVFKFGNTIGFNIGGLAEKLKSPLFQRFKGIHDIDLQGYEEDELLFIYRFQSIYLIYIFPELEDIHQLLEPDNHRNFSLRVANMRFYENLIKRHLYVFDPKCERVFLSKNPINPIRMRSLTTIFPQGKFLVTQRDLESTIPSTISLNTHLYACFCHVSPGQNPLRMKTIDVLLKWSIDFAGFRKSAGHNLLHVEYQSLTSSPLKTIKRIYQSLGLKTGKAFFRFLLRQNRISQNYRSTHLYPRLSPGEMDKICQLKKQTGALKRYA